MSFIAPFWLAVAGVVGAGVILAHFLSTHVPPHDLLPTVRFVPEGAPITVLRSRRLTDVWLMLLRLLAVAAFGVALAGPRLRRDAPARVVLIDRSRGVASAAEARDSVRAVLDARRTSLLVVFDSSARQLSRDSVDALATTAARGSLSAAVVAAHRTIANFPDARERSELVIVSPLAREEVDSATALLLALWEGPVRIARVAAAAPSVLRSWEVRTSGDDPLAVALAAKQPAGPPTSRVVRGTPAAADSAWARSGGALVIWPATPDSGAARPARVQTQQGVVAGANVVVASFARATTPRPGRVIARWLDGQPAATETPLGAGCIREVAIPVDAVGDVALRASFRALAGDMLEPCGGIQNLTPVDSPTRASLGLVARTAAFSGGSRFTPLQTGESRAAVWLALLALLALGAEQLLRRRPGRVA